MCAGRPPRPRRPGRQPSCSPTDRRALLAPRSAAGRAEKSGALWPSRPSRLWQTYQSVGQDYWPPHDHYDRHIRRSHQRRLRTDQMPRCGRGSARRRARALSPRRAGAARTVPTGRHPRHRAWQACLSMFRRVRRRYAAQGGLPSTRRREAALRTTTLASSLGLTSGKDSEACSDEDEQAAETMTHASQVRVRCSHAPRHEISCFQLRPCIISTHSSTRSRVL